MRLKFIGILLCLVATSVFADPPTEADLQKAIKLPYGQVEPAILAIYEQWLNSSRPQDKELAKKYLLRSNLQTSYIDYKTREKIVNLIVEKKVSSLYPAALSLTRTNFNESPTHEALTDAIAVEIPKNFDLRNSIKNGDPALKLAPLMERNFVKLVPTKENAALVQALFKAGAFGADEKIGYPANGGKNSLLEITPNTIDFTKLPQTMAGMADRAGVLEMLMEIRKTLTPKTVPTREAFTAEIMKLIESSSPELALKIAQAARNSMVKDQNERYTKGERYQRNLRTLTINLNDKADLALADSLNNQPVTAKLRSDTTQTVTGLRDVEIIEWKGVPEKPTDKGGHDDSRRIVPGWEKVNYPDINYVYDVDGRRIGDILVDSNFENAHRYGEYSDAPKTALWRKPRLRDRGMYHYPTWPLASATEDCGLGTVWDAARNSSLAP